MKRSVLSMIMAVAVMTASFAQEKRYGIESAILKKNTSVNAQGIKQTFSTIQYISDYGGKESTEMILDAQGQTVIIFTMQKDGYLYTVNMAEKQGTKVKAAGNSSMLNFAEELKKKNQISDVVEIVGDNVQFLGKECKSYESTATIQGQTVKTVMLKWQGVVLKSTVTFYGMTMVDEVTEIQEDVEISAEKFELPEGINFKEVTPKAYQPEKEHVLKGTVAPNFTLPDLTGKQVSLSSLKGKYIVLDFWGSWCFPCIKGMPEMKQYYEKYRDKLEFVGIACRDKDAPWRDAVEKNELNWIQLKNIDSDDASENVSVLYSVEAYPTKFILDKDLKIIAIFQGEVIEFYTRLEQLLD